MGDIFYTKLWVNSPSNRSNHRRCSVRKGVLGNFAKFTGKHLCQILFLIRLQAWGLQLYLKRSSGTDVFLWILRDFQEHLFYRTPPGQWFWSTWQIFIMLSAKIRSILLNVLGRNLSKIEKGYFVLNFKKSENLGIWN